MATTTSFFGWDIPQSTDLVKDGATAIALLGNDIDSSKLFSANKLAMFRDEKASGTNGGTFTSGAWRTRDLNTTVVNNISGCSLAANQITLPAGTYYIQANLPAYSVNSHKSSLYNVTDAAYTTYGTAEYATQTYVGATRSIINNYITIAASKVFELRHYCESTKATNGFGTDAVPAVINVFSEIQIWRVA